MNETTKLFLKDAAGVLVHVFRLLDVDCVHENDGGAWVDLEEVRKHYSRRMMGAETQAAVRNRIVLLTAVMWSTLMDIALGESISEKNIEMIKTYPGWSLDRITFPDSSREAKATEELKICGDRLIEIAAHGDVVLHGTEPMMN